MDWQDRVLDAKRSLGQFILHGSTAEAGSAAMAVAHLMGSSTSEDPARALAGAGLATMEIHKLARGSANSNQCRIDAGGAA